jgi:hypothetical protein
LRRSNQCFAAFKAATVLIGRSERFIIDAIARGLIKAVKSDRRTLLVVQSLKDYAASLPPGDQEFVAPPHGIGDPTA